jgi:hypothetical protein
MQPARQWANNFNLERFNLREVIPEKDSAVIIYGILILVHVRANSTVVPFDSILTGIICLPKTSSFSSKRLRANKRDKQQNHDICAPGCMFSSHLDLLLA